MILKGWAVGRFVSESMRVEKRVKFYGLWAPSLQVWEDDILGVGIRIEEMNE